MSDSILSNRDGLIVDQGTWTPVAVKILSFHSSPTYTTTYSNGVYYRIGKLCYVSCCYRINVTNTGNSYICIEGLPYLPEDRIDVQYPTLAQNCINITSNSRYGSAVIYGYDDKVLVFKHNVEYSGGSYDENQPYELGDIELSFSGVYLINSSYGG